MGSGRRIFAENLPAQLDQILEVTLRSKFLEVPADSVSKLGWDDLVANGTNSSTQKVIAGADARNLVTGLQQTGGGEILSAPEVTTEDGREAQVRMVDPEGAGVGLAISSRTFTADRASWGSLGQSHRADATRRSRSQTELSQPRAFPR